MRIVYFIFILCLELVAREFHVATYNVENLFDLKHDGKEYEEYIPFSKSGWNEQMLEKKLLSLSQVLQDLNADIISLQEVENHNALALLNEKLGTNKYPYVFVPDDSSNIKTTLLSRFPILLSKALHVKNFSRPIYQVKVQVDEKILTIYLNHWPSYKNGLESRLAYAKELEKSLHNAGEYLIIGDFNAPFNVQENLWGKSLEELKKRSYNLWYELPFSQRYSHSFFKSKKALDHIFVSFLMFDGKNIEYKKGSFRVFKPDYLLDENGNTKRWSISQKGKGKHLGVGVSDHLPLIASFETKNYTKAVPKKTTIKELLKQDEGVVDLILERVKVQKVEKYGVYIEDDSHARIFIYRPDFAMKEGEVYSLHVKNLGTYKGRKEITLASQISRF